MENNYQNQFAELKEKLRDNGITVRGTYCKFYPSTQFLTLDMLKKKDWPHLIQRNSIYLDFQIDLENNTVEVHGFGHIWLTKEDSKKKNLCMCSMKEAHQAIGGKWFRLTKFNSIDQAVEKMKSFYSSVHQTMEQVTEGYPYKQMIINIY